MKYLVVLAATLGFAMALPQNGVDEDPSFVLPDLERTFDGNFTFPISLDMGKTDEGGLFLNKGYNFSGLFDMTAPGAKLAVALAVFVGLLFVAIPALRDLWVSISGTLEGAKDRFDTLEPLSLDFAGLGEKVREARAAYPEVDALAQMVQDAVLKQH